MDIHKPIAQRYFCYGLTIALMLCVCFDSVADPQGGALAGERIRVLVSSDIGGDDDDDKQSMVHYLLYADVFDTEGLISSPPKKGRVGDILHVIDVYEKDYPRLKTHSDKYPTPDYLRSISKQGAVDPSPEAGFSESTDGSDWIIKCAQRDDPRPLYVLMGFNHRCGSGAA